MEFVIDSIPEAVPLSKTPYRIGTNKLEEVKRKINELLKIGFARSSALPGGAPALFTKNNDGSQRLCRL